MGRDRSGRDTTRDRDRDQGKERSRRGGGRSQSEEALGAEVPATLGRHRMLVLAGTWRGPESRAAGAVGKKAIGGHRSRCQKRKVAGQWGCGEEVT